MKIGIPRYMFHHEFGGVFSRFLENLGMETLLSPESGAEIFRLGKERVIDEFCYPVKIYCGHVRHLMGVNVDRVFIPIIIGNDAGNSFLCFNQVRMYDIIRNLEIAPREKILTAVFRLRGRDLTDEGFYDLGRRVGAGDDAVREALAMARKVIVPARREQNRNGVVIGLAGRRCLLDDAWAGMDIAGKLRRLGCGVEKNIISEEDAPLPAEAPSHFTLSDWALRDIMAMDRQSVVDGIIYLLPFNCGPDCGVEAAARSLGIRKPFMTIVVDELTGHAGIATRLEAFIDMIKNSRRDILAEVGA